MESVSAHAAALWSGLHLILLLVLSLLVVRQRQKHKITIGDGGVPELLQASRAFGNATEYAPIGVAALAVLVLCDAPPLAVHLAGGMLFIGRLLHAVGISATGGTSIPRAIGTLMTWIAFVFTAVALLFYAIG